MADLTLDVARKILDAALAKGIEKKLKPLVVTILDVRGAVKMTAASKSTTNMIFSSTSVVASYAFFSWVC